MRVPSTITALFLSVILLCGCAAATLHDASRTGNTEQVRALLNKGANVNAKNQAGGTPLHTAAYNGRINTVQLLISKRAKINAKDKDGWAPLHAAAQEGHTDTAQLLKAHGAK